MHRRGDDLHVHHYPGVVRAASGSESSEQARLSALELLWTLACRFPNHTVDFVDGKPLALLNDAFTKVCLACTDISMHVRVRACRVLGVFWGVEELRLLQTFSKQPLAEFERHSKHQSNWVPEGDVTLQETEGDSGWVGAFVHGWEDEFSQVRASCIDAICQLARRSELFATKAIDFLMDMFHDDADQVRQTCIYICIHRERKRERERERDVHVKACLYMYALTFWSGSSRCDSQCGSLRTICLSLTGLPTHRQSSIGRSIFKRSLRCMYTTRQTTSNSSQNTLETPQKPVLVLS